MNAKTKSNPTETCESIKLGIDAHAKWYYVGRQVDGAAPQPVQLILIGICLFKDFYRGVGPAEFEGVQKFYTWAGSIRRL